MEKRYEIATWRFEQLAPALDQSLSPGERQRAIEDAYTLELVWPRTNGEIRRGDPPRQKAIGRSTFYGWLKLYRSGGYDALLPKKRGDRGESRVDRAEQINYAIGLLLEEVERSLTQLLLYLGIEFGEATISRSTLSRQLSAHPTYELVLQLRSKKDAKPRDRYQAKLPHECWQLDGKGPFTVRFTDGTSTTVHVLSVLDCYSRVVVGAVVAPAEDILATILAFNIAARKYGLPHRIQMDRGSAFDSHPCRNGLARLGTHRNWVKVCNPEAQGIVEAYHRCLKRWFIRELKHQEVHDLQHLQGLLDAFLAVFYNRHKHREIGMTPEAKLDGRLCERRISETLLRESFWIETEARVERKTGMVKLPVGLYRAPTPFADSKRTFRYDPLPGGRVVLVTPDNREIELQPFEVKPLPEPRQPLPATGQLQKLYDIWQGKQRPNAQPGFGLPEVLRELGPLLGRLVPATKAEGEQVRAFYALNGPLPREAFLLALARTKQALGPGRPLQNYLDDIKRQMPAEADTTTPAAMENP